MTGLLAQSNAYIRDPDRKQRAVKARQGQVRRPIRLIERLLQELEEMNLKGMKRVPTSYEPRLEEILILITPIAAMPDQVANIKVKVGITKLMDALFAVEEALFSERSGIPMEPEVETFDPGLFTAA